MTFRTFTLKDHFDPAEAARAARQATRHPFPNADLPGLTFLALPSAGADALLPPGEREVQREGHHRDEQLRMAREWVSAQHRG